MSAFYMQWHGAQGLLEVAHKVRFMAQILMEELVQIGVKIKTGKHQYFDTVAIDCDASGFTSPDYVLA